MTKEHDASGAAHTDLPIALVTGAASGIGKAIALTLAGAGYRVACLDRDATALEALLARMPANCCALTVDIADPLAVDAILAALPTAFSKPQMLVNAAGHDPGGTTRFDRGAADDWSRAIETNLTGTMRVTRAILPGMVERQCGDIVNIGSIASLRIVPDMAAYTASKAGLHAFTDVLRADLADTPIRIMEIMPGLTQTDLIRKRYGGDEARADAYYARFKMALSPEDVARTVLFAVQSPPHATLAQIVILPSNRY